MAATKSAFVLATIVSYLDDDTKLVCVNVWNEKQKPVPNKSMVYTWINADEYGELAAESGTITDLQTMPIGIYCEFHKGANDIAGTGTLQATYSEYVERVEARIG